MLSGSKDLAREILKYVDDKRLLKICSISKKMWNEICDENFLRIRLSKYPEIKSIYYISKMREEFEFTYTSGDFKKQYTLIKDYRDGDLIVKAIESGELSLVEYSVKHGAFIRGLFNGALIMAGKHGYADVVRYLMEQLRIKWECEN